MSKVSRRNVTNNSNTYTPKAIVTHNGVFHADDVFACAMLTIIYPDANITRTRDPEIIGAGDFVVDVGGEYDGNKNFDHHQKGGVIIDDKPTAAAGLVWKRFGDVCISKVVGLIDYESTMEVVKRVKETLIDAIDWADLNGPSVTMDSNRTKVPNFTISQAISGFNQEDLQHNDGAFLSAMDFAKRILVNIIRRELVSLKDEEELVTAVEIAVKESSDTLILNKFVSFNQLWKHIKTDTKGLRWVVFPTMGEWRVQQTPWGCFLSEKLRGLPTEELIKVSGVEDAVFVHPAGFIGGAKTKEGVIALSKFS